MKVFAVDESLHSAIEMAQGYDLVYLGNGIIRPSFFDY